MKGRPRPTYVRKLGVYSLAGIAAFAVAVALMLSASSTPTAEAEILTTTGTDLTTRAERNNGARVLISHPGATDTGDLVEFAISDASTASGAFTHSTARSEGQTIVCQLDAPCDVDPDTDDPPDGIGNPQAGVQVALRVDPDSPAGFIIVTSSEVGQDAVTTNVITVNVAPVPTALSVTPAAKSISASPTGTGTVAQHPPDRSGRQGHPGQASDGRLDGRAALRSDRRCRHAQCLGRGRDGG